jgi:hypothetical protein
MPMEVVEEIEDWGGYSPPLRPMTDVLGGIT